MSNSINEAFGNVINAADNVKSNLATAITQKGVQTNSTDSFSKMTENIGKITSGGSNGKKYGVGDVIAGDDIEIQKPVEKKWEVVASPNRQLHRFNVDLLFIDDGNLYSINKNIGEKTKRLSGFSNTSRMVVDGGYLCIITNNKLKKISLIDYTVVREETYTISYSDILADENYIYLFRSDIGVTRINKTTLKDEKTTGEIDSSFDPFGKDILAIEQTNKYLYISYINEGADVVAKITKSNFEYEVKRDTGRIQSMVWDKKDKLMYTYCNNKLCKNNEELQLLKQVNNNFIARTDDMYIKDNRIYLRMDDIFVCVDKYKYEVLFKINLGKDRKAYFFPEQDTDFFVSKYENGTSKIFNFEVVNGYKYKVLR